VRDFLVGPAAAPSNGSIADGRIKRRCPVWEVNEFEGSAENRARVVRFQRLVTKSRGLIAKRHHYCREFRSIDDFILRNWGACVDTVFGHVPRIGRV